MRDTTMVLHKPSRFIGELPTPEFEEDGTVSGLYEPWVLELIAPDAGPALPPADASARLGDRQSEEPDGADDHDDHDLRRLN
jgi:hypothetical protein